MGTFNIGFVEAILMNTHKIGFYEEMSKIIPLIIINTHLISSSVDVAAKQKRHHVNMPI